MKNCRPTRRVLFSAFSAILAGPAAWWIPAAALAGEERPFQPEVCFPADALVYLSVSKKDRLLEGFQGGLVGRILSHPGLRAALGDAPKLVPPAPPAIEAAEALLLSSGEIAAVLAAPEGGGFPRFAAAAELGAKRSEILKALETQEEEPPPRKVGSHPIHLRRAFGDSELGWTILGTHAVLAFPADFLEPIAAAYDAGAPAEGAAALKDARFLSALGPPLKLADRQLLLALDLDRLKALALSAERDKAGFQQFLTGFGLDGARALGLAMGIRDGSLETRIHLATPGGPRGVLGALAAGFSPAEKVEGALELIPSAAGSLLSVRFRPAKVLQDSLLAIKKAAPQLAGKIDETVQELESSSGITLAGDLAPLPPITLVAFSVPPPGGGLFSDSLVLVPSSEFAPYQAVLAKWAQNTGREMPVIEEAGRKIHRGPWLAHAQLDGGWTMISGSVLSIRRYLSYESALPRISKDPALLKECRERLSGAQVGLVLREGRELLATYNTVVSLLNLIAPSVEAYLGQVGGVDPGLLPAGEEFLPLLKDGFLRLTSGPEGFTVEGSRVVDNSGVLPVVAAGGVLAGFLVPTLMGARGQADIVKCQSNLREIQKLGLLYADGGGTRHYPHSPQGGVAALQLLADYHEGLKPFLFVCPGSNLGPAEASGDGRFKLDEGHSSYELAPWELSAADPADTLLAFDRAPYHKGRRNVVYIDGSVESLSEAEFQKKLGEDREKYGGKEKK